VNVADVDGYFDRVLWTFGEIGIILDDGRSGRVCRKWLNQEFLWYRRLQCPLPCPPTFELLKQVSRGYWRYRYKRYKSTSYCVFSNRYRVYPPMECCYSIFSGILVDAPEPGAGRVHLYHPWRYYTGYQVEERAYRDCCSGQNSILCWLFYFLRPPCKSYFWERIRPRLRKLETIFHYTNIDSCVRFKLGSKLSVSENRKIASRCRIASGVSGHLDFIFAQL
jgi:hypothetical protein